MKPKEFIKKFEELVSQIPEGVTIFSVVKAENTGIASCISGEIKKILALLMSLSDKEKEIQELLTSSMSLLKKYQKENPQENE